MGDAADMVLDGDVCQECGQWIEDGGSGFPQSCRDCIKDEERENKLKKKRKKN